MASKKQTLKFKAKTAQNKKVSQKIGDAFLYQLIDDDDGPSASIPKKGRGAIRDHLSHRLSALHQRAILIEQELQQLDDGRFYRTCIFGSARIQHDTPEYANVFQLARMLAWRGIDILTGGGPGLMEAANKGALQGQREKASSALSFGISIEGGFEREPNLHLDIKRHHYKFSSRLDDFMRLSHSIIVTPGGIGTLLELFFSWQLLQVKHLSQRPLVLLDSKFWGGLLDWLKHYPLKRGLISQGDFAPIHIVNTPEEAANIIIAHAEKSWKWAKKNGIKSKEKKRDRRKR
ncbi:MAG TPA: LOG family protein [Oligoflexia bacterium]|nr:LOG family protein [Oligoflexia bacterium]HMP26628.1 LOG family protein [Oligoflexia bacterium]